MKYRVKDPKKRELVKELFDVEIFYSNLADTELRVDLSFASSNFASSYLPVEQVSELEDGWNPYPQTKPERAGHYLVAIKSTTGSDTVDHDIFNGNTFTAWGARVLAWRELPKIWKDL